MKKIKSLLIVLLLILVCGCGSNENNELNNNNNKSEETAKEKEVTIVDLDSNERPIAVMINNHKDARPQSGLSDAYLVYEIMVEGGITRMMALYTQNFSEEKIGSIRSSRHNYLDYALENDAIYVHWGGSTQAYEDINKLKIDHLDGMVYGGTYFTTDKKLDRSLEHTRFTSSSLIQEGIKKLKLESTTDNGYLLNYTTDTVDLSNKENSKVANKVTIKYSKYQTSSYEYNKEEGVYDRYMSGDKHKDLVTGEHYKFKNIIAYSVKYNTIDSSGHQDLENIGSGEGVYITNGYSIPIKWTKKDRKSKTKYTYLDGTEIDVSDGNTFIQIYPTDGKLTIS